jgi:hypothetical protein
LCNILQLCHMLIVNIQFWKTQCSSNEVDNQATFLSYFCWKIRVLKVIIGILNPQAVTNQWTLQVKQKCIRDYQGALYWHKNQNNDWGLLQVAISVSFPLATEITISPERVIWVVVCVLVSIAGMKLCLHLIWAYFWRNRKSKQHFRSPQKRFWGWFAKWEKNSLITSIVVRIGWDGESKTYNWGEEVNLAPPLGCFGSSLCWLDGPSSR